MWTTEVSNCFLLHAIRNLVGVHHVRDVSCVLSGAHHVRDVSCMLSSGCHVFCTFRCRWARCTNWTIFGKVCCWEEMTADGKRRCSATCSIKTFFISDLNWWLADKLEFDKEQTHPNALDRAMHRTGPWNALDHAVRRTTECTGPCGALDHAKHRTADDTRPCNAPDHTSLREKMPRDWNFRSVESTTVRPAFEVKHDAVWPL